jgi:hypothetical protein
MSRKAGPQMRKLLALHNEWLEANGYPLHVKKNKTSQFKAQARHNLQAKLPKSKAQAQAQATRR